MNFNTNKNSFTSALSSIRDDLDAFQSLGIPKATRAQKQQKKSLVSQVTSALEAIDTDDFGIIKTHQ